MPKKVLIVEDNQDMRHILRLVLQSVAHEIIEARDGLEGIGKAVTEGPDLIIMDLGLPDIDGIAVTVKLKQNPRTTQIPVVAYTIWGEDFRERAMEAGMAGFLRKTASPQILRTAIQRILPDC